MGDAMDKWEQAVALGSIFKCLAEAFVNGSGADAACYVVPPEVADALIVVAEFIVEMVKGLG